tara:strand:+ start:200 stop:478 length:279 start_codon:yes stop_codon:yes gene_type:complete
LDKRRDAAPPGAALVAENIPTKPAVVFSIKHRENNTTTALRNFPVGLPHLSENELVFMQSHFLEMWIERILTWLGYKQKPEREQIYRENTSI